MLQILVTNSDLIRKQTSLNELLVDMPKSIKQKAIKFKVPAPAYDYIIGRMLLKKGLKTFNIDHNLEDIKFSPNGKPYLPGIHFNISHTKGLVVCAISKRHPIGIDVEYKRNIELEDFTSFFSKREWSEIHSANDPTDAFLKFWTRKESIIKALGITLDTLQTIDISLKSKQINFKEHLLYLEDLDLGKDYAVAICSLKKISIIQVNFFNSVSKLTSL